MGDLNSSSELRAKGGTPPGWDVLPSQNTHTPALQNDEGVPVSPTSASQGCGRKPEKQEESTYLQIALALAGNRYYLFLSFVF